MAVVDVINQEAEVVSQIDLPDAIFKVEVKPSVLHEVVVMQQAKKRAGSAAVKHRADVRGSTRKLFRQKGTGRARRGSAKSPLLRKGGVVFGPDPKSWGYKVPRKVRKQALKMALSSKLEDQSLIVLDAFKLDRIKTRDFCRAMETLDASKALIVTDHLDANLDLSSRNVPGVKVLKQEGLNVYDILRYQKLVLLASAVEAIERRLMS